jgi:hypothetical protein
MSYLVSTLSTCKELQDSLDNAWAIGELTRDRLNALEAITSFQHPMRAILAPGAGKKRTIEVVFDQRLSEAQVETVEERGCTSDYKPSEATHVYEMDANILEVSVQIDAGDLTNWCGSNPELFTKEIAKLMNVLRRKIATQTAGEVALLSGNWADGVDVDGNNALAIPTKKANGDWDSEGFVDLNIAARDITEYVNDYVIIADSEYWKYLKMVEMGCCANDGINLGSVFENYGYAAMYDSRMAAAMADVDANAFLINIGAVQLLNYVESPWKDGTPVGQPFMGSNYVSMVVTDPVTGLMYDMMIKDECRGKATIVMNAEVQAKALPSNLYAAGDKYDGVNGINKIAISNPLS